MKKSFVALVFFFLLFFPVLLTAQTWKWAKGSDCNHGSIESAPIVLDKAGNVYEAGYAGPMPGYTDTLKSVLGPFTVIDSPMGHQGILVSTDSNGTYRWVLAGQTGQSDFLSLGIDSFGYLYLLGTAPGTVSFGGVSFSYTCFCAKITSSGSVVWVKPLPPAAMMSVSPSGQFYVAGTFSTPSLTIGTTTLVKAGSGSSTDGFIAAYDSSGASLWATSFGGTGYDRLIALGISPANDVYISGNYTSSTMVIGADTLTAPPAITYRGDMFFARYRSTGTPVWAKRMPGDSVIYVNAIVADDYNNVYFTGSYASPALVFAHDTLPPTASSNMILGKYDSAGHQLWARCDLNCTQGYSLAFTRCGNLWQSGRQAGVSIEYTFLLEYDTAGAALDSSSIGVGGDDNSCIAIDDSNNLYLGGDLFHGASFIAGNDTLSITDSTNEALFILKMHFNDTCSRIVHSGVAVTTLPNGIVLFPNPANDECTIQNSNGFPTGSSLTIRDMQGRTLHTSPLSGSTTSIPIRNLPQGIYLCNIHQPGAADVIEKLVVVR